jgi:hypothetical protein
MSLTGRFRSNFGDTPSDVRAPASKIVARVLPSGLFQRWTGAAGSGGAWSQIVLYYSVLAPLCDPILDQVPAYWATHQVAALHEAIEGDADVQFANISPALTGSS